MGKSLWYPSCPEIVLNRVACADTFINFIHHYLHTLTYSNRNYKREEACGGQERACGKGNRRYIYIHCILNQLRYSTTVSQELSPSPVTISPPLCTQVPSRTAWRSSWDTLEARAHLGPHGWWDSGCDIRRMLRRLRYDSGEHSSQCAAQWCLKVGTL